MKNQTKSKVSEFVIEVTSEDGLQKACDEANKAVRSGRAVTATVKESGKVLFYVHEAYGTMTDEERFVSDNW